MLEADLRYPTTTDASEGAGCSDAPPARPILEVEVLDGQTTRFGDLKVTSRSDPMFAMARRLVKEGHDPETIVRFRWAATGTQSFKDAPLRVFAALTVEENDRGIRVRRYGPPRLWGVAGKESREALTST